MLPVTARTGSWGGGTGSASASSGRGGGGGAGMDPTFPLAYDILAAKWATCHRSRAPFPPTMAAVVAWVRAGTQDPATSIRLFGILSGYRGPMRVWAVARWRVMTAPSFPDTVVPFLDLDTALMNDAAELVGSVDAAGCCPWIALCVCAPGHPLPIPVAWPPKSDEAQTLVQSVLFRVPVWCLVQTRERKRYVVSVAPTGKIRSVFRPQNGEQILRSELLTWCLGRSPHPSAPGQFLFWDGDRTPCGVPVQFAIHTDDRPM